MKRRTILALLAVTALAWGERSAIAGAPDPRPFDQGAFDAARKAGKPILVEVTAPWCPACKAQAPILGKLRLDPRFKDLETFTIDFDTNKDAMRKVGARLQSTLICYKGERETARSIGETQAEWIEAQLEKTMP